MRTILHIIPVCLAICSAALADISGAPTLSSGQSLSFDTGAVSTTGGDILWNGQEFTLVGNATAFDLDSFGFTGSPGFDILEEAGQTVLPAFKSLFTGGPLQSLIGAVVNATGSVFSVYTNGGNYAVVLLTAQSGTSVTLLYWTFGASQPSGPFITQVLNNYSLVPAGLPSSGIAPGSLFIIQGSGLAAATSVSALQSSAAGLPKTLTGTSVSLTDSSGATTSPAFYYAINSQLALVMPSGVATGDAVLTVTYNGQTSPPYTIQIVPTAMGFATASGSGIGIGIATDPNSGAFFGYSNPIPPGAQIVLWGSGLGADPARDTTFTPGAFAINNLARVYVGGVPATIEYQGASGYPGVNQINIQVPQNVPTGCFVSVVGVTANGVPTSAISLPIASGECADPALGFTGSLLTQQTGEASLKIGSVGMSYLTEPNTEGTGTQTTASAYASFQQLPGAGIGSSSVSVGSCNLAVGSAALPQNTTPPAGLSAGVITVTPPSIFSQPVTLQRDSLTVPGFYDLTLPAGFLTSSGGAFSFSGTAGTAVGQFTVQIIFSSPLFTWTNQTAAANVSRAAGLPITWTGGDPGTIVTITGNGLGAGSAAAFLCAADAAAGQFTVPSWILQSLPAGEGLLTVGNQTQDQTFSASGLDVAGATGVVGYRINATYQ